MLNLKVIHRRHCTGFEQARELPLHIDDLIAGRYQVRGRSGMVKRIECALAGSFCRFTGTCPDLPPFLTLCLPCPPMPSYPFISTALSYSVNRPCRL